MRSPSLSGVALLWVLLVLSAVAAPGHAAAGAATHTAETPAADATPTPGTENGTHNGTVVFYDQTTQGEELVVAEATLPEGGFVALFEGSLNGTLLGSSTYLDAGDHENLGVTLSTRYANDTTVVAVLYRDADGNRTFDRAVDDPYRVDGDAVSAAAYVTSAPTPAATASPTVALTTTGGDETATDTQVQGPGFGVVAALAALLLGAALFRRTA